MADRPECLGKILELNPELKRDPKCERCEHLRKCMFEAIVREEAKTS